MANVVRVHYRSPAPIVDCGFPGGPGWQLMAAILITAHLLALMMTVEPHLLAANANVVRAGFWAAA